MTLEAQREFRDSARGVKHLAVFFRWFRARLSLRRVHLALSLRVTVAAILALVSAQLLGLRVPLWAVMTAVIVTQMSVGRSLKATGDYLTGTLGGRSMAEPSPSSSRTKASCRCWS